MGDRCGEKTGHLVVAMLLCDVGLKKRWNFYQEISSFSLNLG